MADCKNGIQTGMGTPNYGDKERDQDEELDEGIPSLADCWELVGSGPGSPLPEVAVVDGSTLEEAMAVACATGGSLQDDYFACTHSLSEHDVLPLSTVMANRQREEEGHFFIKINALVSLDSEAEAGENCTNASYISPIAKCDEYKEGIGPMHGGSHMPYDDYVSRDEDMHLDDSICHDDYPHRMFLDKHPDVTDVEQCKTNDANPVMYNSELMEHDDFSHIGNDTYDHYSSEEYVNQSLASNNAVESMAVGTIGHQSSTLAVSQASELSSSLHGMHDNSMDIHHRTAEDGLSPTAEDGLSPTVLGDVNSDSSCQVEVSPAIRGSLINSHDSGHGKVFTCASWLWTQLSRWQAQLGYAKTIWSVAFAAAVMGILFLGRGWQRLQAQNHSLRSQLWAKEKRITQLMFQLMQTKEALTKTRRVPVICVKPALQIPQGHV